MKAIRYLGAGLLLLATVAAAGPARAQYMKHEVVVSAGGGVQYATGPLGDILKAGSGLQADVGYFLNTSWELSLRAAYHTFDTKSAVRLATGQTGMRFVSGSALASLYLYPESWFTPYVAGGTGLFRVQPQFDGNAASSDRTRVGVIGGFGISAHKQGSRISFYTDLLYHHILTDHGGSHQFVAWHSGLRLSFGGRPF